MAILDSADPCLAHHSCLAYPFFRQANLWCGNYLARRRDLCIPRLLKVRQLSIAFVFSGTAGGADTRAVFFVSIFMQCSEQFLWRASLKLVKSMERSMQRQLIP